MARSCEEFALPGMRSGCFHEKQNPDSLPILAPKTVNVTPGIALGVLKGRYV